MPAYTMEELKSMIVVNMGDFKLARGEQKLITRDLGSCVGIAIRDPGAEVGGLLHIMLPEYNAKQAVQPINLAKYADAGLDEMVKGLILKGADKSRLVAKIAGAAHMVRTEDVPEDKDISSRNLAAVKKKLANLGIPVLAEEVGNYYPRTVVFELHTGGFRIITSGMQDRLL